MYFSVRFSRWLLCYFAGGYGTDVSLTYERTVHTSSITITRHFLPPASDPSQARTALTPASCGVLRCKIPFSFSKGLSIIVVRIFNKFPFDLCSPSPCSPLLPRCRLPRLQTLVEVLCAFSLAARPATAVVNVSVALGNARTFANVAPGKHRWYALWLGRANDGRVPRIVYGGWGSFYRGTALKCCTIFYCVTIQLFVFVVTKTTCQGHAIPRYKRGSLPPFLPHGLHLRRPTICDNPSNKNERVSERTPPGTRLQASICHRVLRRCRTWSEIFIEGHLV